LKKKSYLCNVLLSKFLDNEITPISEPLDISKHQNYKKTKEDFVNKLIVKQLIIEKMKKNLLLLSVFAILIACNGNMNVGSEIDGNEVSDVNLTSDKKNSLSPEEFLALYISQQGSSISAENIRERLVSDKSKILSTEAKSKFKEADINVFFIKPEKYASCDIKEDIPLYVFQNKDEQGFVVVTGDIRLPQVIAFSDKGKFDPFTKTETGLDVFNERLPYYLSDSLAKYQALYEERLTSAYSNLKIKKPEKVGLKSTSVGFGEPPLDIVYTKDIDGEPEPCFDYKDMGVIFSSVINDIGPLVQVEWGQGYPYDKFCPNLGCPNNNGHALVGCVAVACGQIMSYHQYPSSLDGVSLDWNNMTASPSINSLSSTYQDQIAHALHVIGVGVWMDYGCSASGSHVIYARPYLMSLGYSCGSICGYDLSTIQGSLNNYQPLYIRGSSPTGTGHAWVIDGYKTILAADFGETHPAISVIPVHIFCCNTIKTG
jgi:hypothetical protein